MKKIALLGLAAGLMLASNAQAMEATADQGNHFIASSCGAGSCSGQKNKGYTADRARPSNYTAEENIYSDQTLRTDTPSNLPRNDASSSDMVSETELLSAVDDQSKAEYSRLDSDGKMLARKLAAQPQYSNGKSQAIREATKRMAEKKGSYNTNQRPQNTQSAPR